jgi:endo-1,4-beta-xylanase
VPVDAIGLQAHLRAFRDTFDEKQFSRFLADIRSLGFKIMVTELDVADIGGPVEIDKRDAEVASLTRRFLDVVFDSRICLGVLTWGISDRYSWLSEAAGGYAWPDGQLSRGLPLDENFKRKPMWHAMANAFAASQPPINTRKR